MKTLFKYITAIIFLTLLFAPFNSVNPKSKFYSGNNLTPEEIEFLNTAYKDESKCQYFFNKVIEKFPDAAGFMKILNSEKSHVSALESIYNKYQMEIPTNLDFSNISIPSSVDEACTIALKYEKENAEMYNKFLQNISNNLLKTVFEDLRDITLNRNIPAVEKCK